tara:strand:+ start:166 stop:492 length:327 start_codon:yes stop_codon:yes gene_type:complete
MAYVDETLLELFPEPDHVLVNVTVDGVTMMEWVTPVSDAYLEANSEGEYQVSVIPHNGDPFGFTGNLTDTKILEDAVFGFLRPAAPKRSMIEIMPGVFIEHQETGSYE